MWPNPPQTADLITFTEEILHEKLHFFVQWDFRHDELNMTYLDNNSCSFKINFNNVLPSLRSTLAFILWLN